MSIGNANTCLQCQSMDERCANANLRHVLIAIASILMMETSLTFFFLGARPECKLHRSKRKECTRKGSPEEIRHLNRIRKRKETKRRRDAVKDCRSYHYEEMISQDIPIDFVNRNSEQVSVVNMGGRQLYFPMPSDIDRYNSLK